VFETGAAAGQPEARPEEDRRLPPLTGARRLAVREDGAGCAAAELVAADGGAAGLFEAWRRAGWSEAETSSDGRPARGSPGVWVKGSEAVQVWPLGPSEEAVPRLFFLVRAWVPGGEATR
jgi:hypothetical protein